MTEAKVEDVWRSYDNSVLYLLFKEKEFKNYDKIAAFDLDGTLIKTELNLNKKWEWIYPSIPIYMKKLYESGWNIVIFTNRKDAGNSPTKQQLLINRLTDIARTLDVPIDIFASIKDDKYRKPGTGMWDLYVSLRGKKVGYFIGDAEGSDSPVEAYRWSDSDKQFAKNTGLIFTRPSDIFLK